MNARQQNAWFSVYVECASHEAEAVANFLFECGAEGVLQPENAVIAYFPSSVNQHKVQASLNQYLRELSIWATISGRRRIVIAPVPNRDWNAEWKKNLHPIIISKKIAIKPTWFKDFDCSSEHVIELDPQMAFGTGYHETTQLILRLMDKHVQLNGRVLDVGTGSGILAIAAAKLGASRVVAFDIDHTAIMTAKANCQQNNVRDRVHLFNGTIDALRRSKYNLVLANINRVIIQEMLSSIAKHIDPSAVVIFSGILTSEKELICAELLKNNFKISKIQSMGEWLALVAKFS